MTDTAGQHGQIDRLPDTEKVVSTDAPTIMTLAAEVAALQLVVQQLSTRLDTMEAGTVDAQPRKTDAVRPEVTAATPKIDPASDDHRGAPELDPLQAMRAVLIAAFTLAMEPIPADIDEANEQFGRFAALMHTDRRGTPLLEQSLRNYTWQQLRRNVAIYLNAERAPGSFETTRITPATITSRTQQAKFFVSAETRMPTPITFRRDAAENGAWRIESSSL